MVTSAGDNERFLETEAQITLCGHVQQSDASPALAGLHGSPREQVRALGALHRRKALTADQISTALQSPHTKVCIRALELAISYKDVPLDSLLHHEDPLVAVTAAWAIGERGANSASTKAVTALCELVRMHEDARVREAAVAALGTIGDPEALSTVIAATKDKVSVRRRAAVALAAFDDPLAELALSALLRDRDWQVRQIAEDLLLTDESTE